MLIDISPKGEGKCREGVEFAKYTQRKEGDYSERRTREGRCGITFRERRFGYSTDRSRKKFDLYDLCFGEHRFAVCEDVWLVISTAFYTFLAQTFDVLRESTA